jgi:tetratricopeptide (TPR) repeat protein
VDAAVTWHVAVLLPTTLASAYLLLDEVPKAVPLADRAVAEARRLGVWPAGVDALRLRALVAVRQGDADQARSALHEGLQHARSIPFPYAEARLLEASALLDREEGDDTSAHASLEEALALYARLGAQRDVTRLRSAPIP